MSGEEILPTVVQLTRPVRVLEAEVTTLELREPNGLDLSECGLPVRFLAGGRTEIDAKAMSAMIARLAKVPITAVQSLRAADWNQCAMIVAGFLSPGAQD